jgi:hypothetical protein
MEDNEQLELQKEAPEDEQVDFDGWYASREDAIPAQHRKEILLADFDEALRKYGVKLG